MEWLQLTDPQPSLLVGWNPLLRSNVRRCWASSPWSAPRERSATNKSMALTVALDNTRVVLAHLVVVLPGGNNDPWTALLLLPALAFEELGARVERVSYEEARVRGLGLEDSGEFNARVTEQVTEILDILATRPPCRALSDRRKHRR